MEVEHTPPKARITKDMILDAAFAIAREEGADRVNARTVAAKLGCSTQPVMYHFRTMEELQRAVYEKADAYHSTYLITGKAEGLLGIGLNYVRFAADEKNLFCLLFQTNQFRSGSIPDLISASDMAPIVEAVSEEAQVDLTCAKNVLRLLFLTVHGYASMYANNELRFDEKAVSEDLVLVLQGILAVLKEDI